MSSPCPGAKLTGCRVRDLASCFLACRMSLDEQEPDISCSRSPPKASNGSIAHEEHAAESQVPSSLHHTCGGGCREAEGQLRFAEEDFIVFCFGDDGEIQMINDAKLSETNARTSSQAATSKPMVGEIEEEMNPSQRKMDSFESCDSNLSDTSTTSSFAFPALGVEWIGSPVHMPNTEKHSTPTLSKRCCRFVRRLH